MPSAKASKQAQAAGLSPEELSKALEVKPPSDPQAIEDHVHQLLMRAQVSWLSKRDVLDILTNWQVYNLPISLMPPDQPGRAFYDSTVSRNVDQSVPLSHNERVTALNVCDVWPV